VLVTPAVEMQLPFSRATGQGLKIAVIDSGVNARHPHIVTAPQGGAVFCPQEEFQPNSSWEDMLGHGTAVTAAIQEKAPGAEYYALKVFGTSLRTTSMRLIQALEWALDHGMDIVNLSLGTPNFDFQADLENLVRRAAESGVLLVSARQAGDRPVLPGVLHGVIGVELDWELPRERYRIGEIEGVPCYWASGYPRSLPGMSPARNLNGISFAVANMTGFVARACEGLAHRSVGGIREVLAFEARCWSTGAV
jgi:subtilisin family serine protease